MSASGTVTAVTATLTHTAASISLTTLILGAVFAALFLYALFAGKSRALALLFSLYPAQLLTRAFPFTAASGLSTLAAGQTFSAFIIILLASAFLLRNLFADDFPFGRLKRWFEAALLSLCTLALGLVGVYQLIASESATFFSGFFRTLEPLIASPTIFFFVLVGPILASLIFGRRSFY